jgi:hypothetical protein
MPLCSSLRAVPPREHHIGRRTCVRAHSGLDRARREPASRPSLNNYCYYYWRMLLASTVSLART